MIKIYVSKLLKILILEVGVNPNFRSRGQLASVLLAEG